MDIFDHCASQLFVALLHSSGAETLLYYYACLVFIRAKYSDWLVMLVWLRVKALITLVGELMDSKVISSFFYM